MLLYIHAYVAAANTPGLEYFSSSKLFE